MMFLVKYLKFQPPYSNTSGFILAMTLFYIRSNRHNSTFLFLNFPVFILYHFSDLFIFCLFIETRNAATFVFIKIWVINNNRLYNNVVFSLENEHIKNKNI